MKYLNIRVFDFYCPLELVKEVISFKLEPGDRCQLRNPQFKSKKITIINYYEYIISKNYFSFIVTAIIDIFWIIEEEPERNSFLRSLSIS